MTREEAIDCINAIHVQMFNSGNSKWTEACDMAIEALKDRPHGEWKHAIVDCCESGYMCPHCNGCAVIDGKSDGYSVTFCPNCGSDNRPKEGDMDG